MSPGTSALAICRHGVVLLPRSEKAEATAFPQPLNPLPCSVGQLVNAASTVVSSSVVLINDFRPSHLTKAFGLAQPAEPPPAVVPVLSSTLLPGFAGRNFLATTASSRRRTDATLKHSTGLTEYRASRYFARLPTCAAEAGSLTLCTVNVLWLPSDPTVGQ